MIGRLFRALRPHADAPTSAELGRLGERRAAKFLKRGGYRIIGRNLGLTAAQVDLLALAPDRRTVVVVEVKARRRTDTADHYGAEVNLKPAQLRRLLAAAGELRRRNRWHGRPIRVDLVTVEWTGRPRRTAPVFRHYTGLG